ncbi:MAG: hypothetical protein CMM47_04550 [Rhodospirillaceae bacterium]|nr:hypothetical protein [Rhodospirillaceae bacterium]
MEMHWFSFAVTLANKQLTSLVIAGVGFGRSLSREHAMILSPTRIWGADLDPARYEGVEQSRSTS